MLRRFADFPDDAVAKAFALIRELSERVLGMRHFDVQIIGAFAMIKGMLAEMATGEGKTLTATLVAGTAGLAGLPVHVITVNDYLVQRDAELMGPLYRELGLSVGVVIGGQNPQQRRDAYACDITYCTNKELTFDYLRDRMLLGQSAGELSLKMEAVSNPAPRSRAIAHARAAFRSGRRSRQRSHRRSAHAADHFRRGRIRTSTPMRLRGRSNWPTRWKTDVDYLIAAEERRVFLTVHGQEKVTAFAENRGKPWNSIITREELAREALAAIHLFRRGEHYVVVDGKVQIVDEYTGRVMPDRFWSDGLHQMIEHKEGCEQSNRRTTIARITYQRFFRRYRRLTGMSGTLQPVARELWRVYRKPVVTIPTAKPVHRVHRPDVVVHTEAAKWKLIVERVAGLHARGIPVFSAPARLSLPNAPAPNCRPPDCPTPCSMPSRTTTRPKSSPRPASADASPSRPTWPDAAPISISATA